MTGRIEQAADPRLQQQIDALRATVAALEARLAAIEATVGPYPSAGPLETVRDDGYARYSVYDTRLRPKE